MAGLIPFNRNKGNLKTTGLDDFYNVLDSFFEDTWAPMRGFQSDTFKLDVRDNEKEYKIEAELPGVKKDEIRLEMKDGKLAILIERNEEVNDEKKNYIHRERRTCSMQRSVYLKDAKDDGIKAKLNDGVLNITVPKDVAKTTTKTINID